MWHHGMRCGRRSTLRFTTRFYAVLRPVAKRESCECKNAGPTNVLYRSGHTHSCVRMCSEGSPRVQYTYDVHALPSCSDMQISATCARPTAVTVFELRRCSVFNGAAAPHAAWHSQHRQLVAAPQSVDEYVTIERHRVRCWIGEARRRKRDVLSCLRAHTGPSGMRMDGDRAWRTTKGAPGRCACQ